MTKNKTCAKIGLMAKQITCKYCGSHTHYSYMCFQNPKRKSALKRKYSQYKAGKTPKHDKVLSAQTLDRKRLILELDKYCSLIVRISASDKYGVVNCYTCGKRIPWKLCDNGHYRSRQALQTRWDFLNCHCQCQNCNRLLRGNLSRYREHLVREIGENKVLELETRPAKKISTPELKEMLDDLKLKYKQVVEEKRKLNLL